MSIAKQCYIRDIKKEHRTLLEKAGRIFHKKTSPSIFLRLLEQYFLDAKQISQQQEKIKKLEEALSQKKSELSDFKAEIKKAYQLETKALEAKNNIKAKLQLN